MRSIRRVSGRMLNNAAQHMRLVQTASNGSSVSNGGKCVRQANRQRLMLRYGWGWMVAMVCGVQLVAAGARRQ